MERLVTRGEYDSCVAARDCKPLDKTTPAERPAVGLSHYDAIAYAKWLSRRTGENWRLPTDREWALAAGARYKDDAWTEVSDPANPSRRWMAIYDAESTTPKAVEPDPQPIGQVLPAHRKCQRIFHAGVSSRVHRSGPNLCPDHESADFDLHKVAATQLAVDS